MQGEGVIRHYGRFLPPVPDDSVVTLPEGNTPLVPAPRLAREIAPGNDRKGETVVRTLAGHGL